MKCLQCNHEWMERKVKPACCPKCKSYFWDCEKSQNTNVLKGEAAAVKYPQSCPVKKDIFEDTYQNEGLVDKVKR